MDYSPPGSSVHGIFQARVLEWGGERGGQEYKFQTTAKLILLLEKRLVFLTVSQGKRVWLIIRHSINILETPRVTGKFGLGI